MNAQVQFTISGIGAAKQDVVTATGSKSTDLEEVIGISGVNTAITYALDLSATKLFYIVSDQNVTVKTNSSSVPDDTLTLTAGIPQVWVPSVTPSGLLTADIAALYVSNDNPEVANIYVKSLEDATP